MNTDLYASPEEIKMRMPLKRNVWLGTLTNSIVVILKRYMIDRDSFELEETKGLEYGDKEKIDKFLAYLHKQGRMWEGKSYEINETITLLSKDKNISGVEKIINDLTEVLINVKNKKIENPEKLIPYFNIFHTFSDVVSRGIQEPCNIFAYDDGHDD